MSFDRLAKYYSSLEWLLAGDRLQTCRTAFLSEAQLARSILLVGEGHGKFLEELCAANLSPSTAIWYVDASSEMARVAKDRLTSRGAARQVHFQTTAILEFSPSQTFDLIVTQFFLDCFQGEELERVIKKLTTLMSPERGRWIVADFQVSSAGWRRVRSRAVLFLAYRFFRLVTQLPAGRLEPPQKHLRGNELHLVKRVESNFGLLYSEVWEKRSFRDVNGGGG